MIYLLSMNSNIDRHSKLSLAVPTPVSNPLYPQLTSHTLLILSSTTPLSLLLSIYLSCIFPQQECDDDVSSYVEYSARLVQQDPSWHGNASAARVRDIHAIFTLFFQGNYFTHPLTPQSRPSIRAGRGRASVRRRSQNVFHSHSKNDPKAAVRGYIVYVLCMCVCM